MGNLVSSPREREKRHRRDSKGDERDGQGRKRKMNKSEETEEIKTFPLYPNLPQEQQALPICKPISVGRKLHDTFASPNHPKFSIKTYVVDTH